MGVSIPDSYDLYIKDFPPTSVDHIGPVGPVTLNGIPDTYHVNIDHLPKISLGVDPVHYAIDSLPKIQIGSDPLDLSIRVREIPSVRSHLPADFCLGIAVLGIELLTFRLCGEAQVITEPYEPNPCEQCGRAAHREGPANTPTTVPSLQGRPVTPGVRGARPRAG
jgi:hypothetical protein